MPTHVMYETNRLFPFFIWCIFHRFGIFGSLWGFWEWMLPSGSIPDSTARGGGFGQHHEGRRGRGRLKLTWEQVVRTNMASCGTDGTLTEEIRALKATIHRSIPATGGIRAYNEDNSSTSRMSLRILEISDRLCWDG